MLSSVIVILDSSGIYYNIGRCIGQIGLLAQTEEPWLHGVWISNVNVLTDDDLDHCDEALGSWPLKTMQCKVYKVKRYEAGAPLPL